MDIGALLALPKDIAGAVGEVLANISLGSVTPRMKMVLEPFEEFFKKFTGGVKDILDPFAKLNEFATHFVQEFDPALVANLGQRFRDLNAVIGIALRPIVDIARDVVKALGDQLLPVMKQLEPIVREITGAVADNLIAGFEELADFLFDMMPAFEGMKEVILGLLPILDDLKNLLRALRMPLISLIGDLIASLTGGQGGGGIKGAMESFRKGVQDVFTAIVQFVAQMLALTGQVKALQAMMDSTKPRPLRQGEDSMGMAIALNPMFKSIGELSKSVQLAMFAASDVPGGRRQGVEQSNELLDGIQKAIVAGRKDALKNQEWFNRKVDEVKTAIAEVKAAAVDVAVAVRGGKKILDDVLNWRDRQFGEPGLRGKGGLQGGAMAE